MNKTLVEEDDISDADDDGELSTGALDDETLVSELDLSCYPLDDDSFEQHTPERPAIRKQPTPSSKHIATAPTTMLSPNGFQKRIAQIRNENDRLRSDISRIKKNIVVSIVMDGKLRSTCFNCFETIDRDYNHRNHWKRDCLSKTSRIECCAKTKPRISSPQTLNLCNINPLSLPPFPTATE